MENEIAIINSGVKGSGIGRYSVDLSHILNAKLYSIIYDKHNTGYPGYQIKSSIPKMKGNYLLNIKFQNILYRKEIHDISKKYFIHYSSQEIRPFKNAGNSVTVQDTLGFKGDNKVIKNNLSEYKKFKNVLTMSEYVSDELHDMGFGTVKVIYPGIKDFYCKKDKITLRKELGLPADKLLLLNVSNSRPRKNLVFLKKVYENLNNDYRLVTVGNDLGKNLSFNLIDDEKLNDIYNACDVLVYPSTDEGFGYPMAEAFKTGLPVLASNIPIFQEISGDAAYLSELQIDEFVHGLKSILQNRDFYSEKALERAKIFDWNLYQKNVKSYFDSLI